MISLWLHIWTCLNVSIMHFNFFTMYLLFSSSGLWAVVNNAGISDWAEIEWSSIEDFHRMVDINLFGCIRTSIAFLPLIRATKG